MDNTYEEDLIKEKTELVYCSKCEKEGNEQCLCETEDFDLEE